MPYSVYSSQTPATLDVNAIDSDVTLGMQWYSESDGVVRGARFYLGNRNFDTHQVIGALYAIGNTTPLAQKSYTVTSANAIGWVTITFDQSIIVTRNQTYVIAMWFPGQQTLPGGKAHYVATTGFFANGIDNPPLHAFKNDTIFNYKFNNVYSAGSSLTYPTNTNGASYFVDVVFDYMTKMKVRAGGAWVEHPAKTRVGSAWQL